MESKTCRLLSGVALLCAAVVFLALPKLLDLEAPRLYDPTYGRVLTEGFIPVIFSLMALVSGIAVLISGRASR
jgi:hypothetical protein